MRIVNITTAILALMAQSVGLCGAVRAVSPDWEIVAGKRIGQVRIGETRAGVHASLNAPDTMRSLGGTILQERWLGKVVNPSSRAQCPDYVTVYYQNGVVRQVEASSWQFETPSGLNTLSRFSNLEAAYPPTHWAITAFSPSRGGVALRMYYDDDTVHGIAWKGALESGMIPNITGDMEIESLIVHAPMKYVIKDPGGHGDLHGDGPITTAGT